MPEMFDFVSRKTFSFVLLVWLLTVTGIAHAYDWQTTTVSGGEANGVDSRFWTPSQNANSFEISYDFYGIPDSIDIFYGGQNLFSSGYISYTGTIPISLSSTGIHPGVSLEVKITMNAGGPRPGTAWTYTFSPTATNWVLHALEIAGPGEMLANTQSSFTATAVFQRLSGSSTTESRRQVLATWAPTPAGLFLATMPVAGRPQLTLTATAPVGQAKEAKGLITASYSDNGISVSDSLAITVKSAPITNSQDREKTADPNKNADSKLGGPISMATGAESFHKPLLSISGAREFEFGLDYSSTFSANATSSVGNGWSHAWSPTIEESADRQIATVRWSPTRVNTYTYVQAQARAYYTCAEDGGSTAILSRNADGSMSITEPDLTQYLFSAGGTPRTLQSVSNPRGQKITFTQGSYGVTQASEPISGALLNFTYTNGKITGISDNAGRTVALAYNAGGLLTSITDPDGKTVQYGYNADKKMVTVTAADGTVIYRNTYDALGRVVSQDDGLSTNKPMTFSYDEKSKPGFIVTTATDRNGGKMVYTHDANYRLLSIKNQLGGTTSYTYDAKGNRITVTDPLRRVTWAEYDDAGRPTHSVAPDGAETWMEYDSTGNLVKLMNSLGKVATFKFDANGNPIESVDFAGQKTTRVFDSNSLLTSVTTPGGKTTAYGYTGGRLISITNPLAEVTRMAYDSAGRVIGVTDPANNTSNTTYTPAGKVLENKNPLGATTRFAYDDRGRIVSATDPLGGVVTTTYDANGNILTATNPLGGITSNQYDGEGRPLKTTDANGHTVTSSYDAVGRVVSVTDALGKTTKMAYDAAGNLLSATDPTGAAVTTTYSLANLPVAVSDALGRTTTISRDALGQPVSSTDPLNRTTSTSFDELGRPVKVTDPLGIDVRKTFDSDGNLTAIYNGAGAATTFAYDNAGRQKTSTTPTGRATTATYNNRGLLASTTKPSGQATAFTYDAAGRLTRSVDPAGTIDYTYDSKGRPLTVTESGKTLTRTYDALDRLTSFTDRDGNKIEYSYDPVGNLASLKYPDGKTVTYTYDAANRLARVQDWAARTTSYTYDAAGRLVLTTRPNGTTQQRGYDKAGQLVALRELGAGGKIIASYAVTCDPAGQIISEARTPETAPAVPSLVAMTYDADDRLTVFDGKPVTQDPDGNMVNGPVGTGFGAFTYDARNRLTSAGGLTYRYDAENRRVESQFGSTVTKFVNNPNAPLWQVLAIQPAGSPTTFCVYGIGLIYTETSGQPLYHHYDLRGSTVATTDAARNTTFSAAYDAYGKRQNLTGSPATPFLFVGQFGVMTDANDLCFKRARYYSSTTHRFVNADPIGLRGGTNLYSYVGGRPISLIDPWGLIALGGRDGRAASYSNRIYQDYSGGLLDEKGILHKPFTDGFNAALYRDADGLFYLTFAGTDPLSGSDWLANVSQAFGRKSSQYEQAVDLARNVKSALGGNVILTGHSLGGGEASAASYATGLDAITFNAAGLSSRYSKGKSGEITAHFIRGDILSTLQDFSPLANAAGNRHGHSGNTSAVSIGVGLVYGAEAGLVVEGINRHSITQFLQ